MSGQSLLAWADPFRKRGAQPCSLYFAQPGLSHKQQMQHRPSSCSFKASWTLGLEIGACLQQQAARLHNMESLLPFVECDALSAYCWSDVKPDSLV